MRGRKWNLSVARILACEASGIAVWNGRDDFGVELSDIDDDLAEFIGQLMHEPAEGRAEFLVAMLAPEIQIKTTG